MAKKEKELEKIKKDNEQDIGSTADDEKVGGDWENIWNS